MNVVASNTAAHSFTPDQGALAGRRGSLPLRPGALALPLSSSSP